jgi:hypothetical protein
MHRLLWLLAALLIALPVAGCGADDVNPDAVAQAADKTANAKGARFTATATSKIPGFGDIPMKMQGVTDLTGKQAQMTFDMSGFADAAPTQGQVDGDDLKGEIVLTGTKMFMKMPIVTRELKGKEWLSVDLKAALEGSGVDFAQLQQLSSTNPAEQIAWLKQMGDIEEVGDGHYKGTIDVRKLPGGGERLAQMSGASTFPVEVWVNDDGYIERQKMTMAQKIQGVTTKTEMDMRFSDFGTPVMVKPPSADNVQDVTALAKQGVEQQGR